ncbi:beta-1,6-N-acetylglucosaminyltransferase, contains WSC domain [Phaffia rhodozyma]|uniref:Beta-1,6-N-acetylglucosaminyltransferase, contains WSC domain n=1 Tax=Phaffia rhodozyma TaxID=264483 RepID=A0A0F7SSS6_PHARH|nr:beta-1,6-N-acetylglucosaminyltransferase, contains WSC domain [Phaffia rhodozyma]
MFASTSTTTVLSALLLASSSAMAMPSLGHHANSALTTLSHLPIVGGYIAPNGLIETSVEAASKRDLDRRYYGDSRGFTRPDPLGPEKRALATGWSSLGCVTEGKNVRTLSGYAYYAGSVTPETCMANCLQKGYTIAGVEWGDECYCGNSFAGGGGAASTACNVACVGDSSSTCGGNYTLNAYQYNSASASASAGCSVAAATSVTSSKSASASASTSASASSSAFQTSIRSSSAVASSTSTASAASATSTSSSSTTTEWEALGCFVDNPSLRSGKNVLLGSKLTSTTMTISTCQTRCAGQGYNFAGLENSDECWCGDLTTADVAGLTSNTVWCNMPCTGKSSESCGGGWSLQLYEQVDVSTSC